MSNLVSSLVVGLVLDMRSNNPVMILKPENLEDQRHLIIWIGAFEASMITSALLGVQPQRPMTHDLLLSVIKATGASLEKISVTSLRDRTYYAKLHLVVDGVETMIDVRPSDAVALAVRAEVPILVEESLFAVDGDFKTGPETTGERGAKPAEHMSPETLKERIRNLNPEDFGKYSA